MRWPGLVALAWFCCVTFGWVARGNEAEEDKARDLYVAGEAAFKTGDYQVAYEDFSQSYTISQKPALLYNMASALQRLQRPHDAAQALASYLRLRSRDPERAAIEERIRTLEEGQRLLDAERAAAGERKPESSAGASGRGAWHTAGIATMAIGGASLIVSAGLYGYLRNVVVAGCNTSTAQCPATDLGRANAHAGTYQSASMATVITGGILVAAGVVAFVLTRPHAKAASAQRPAIFVAPLALDGPGAVVVGRF
jgi:tetratricopeptide (TPR) repeat protein